MLAVVVDCKLWQSLTGESQVFQWIGLRENLQETTGFVPQRQGSPADVPL